MPDQSSAANEHAILDEITGPLATLPDDPVPLASEVDFPVVLRGYDRLAVDAYVKKTTQLIAELQSTRSPEAAVRRALERVGEQISGILQRAHDTAEEITAQSRGEAEDRLEQVRREAAELTARAEARMKELDVDIDRIWGERQRIIDDVRDLSRELTEVAGAAATRFPPAEEPAGSATPQGHEQLAPDEGDDATAVLPTVDLEAPGREAPPHGDPLLAAEADDAYVAAPGQGDDIEVDGPQGEEQLREGGVGEAHGDYPPREAGEGGVHGDHEPRGEDGPQIS